MSKNGRYEDGNYVVWDKDDLFHREDGPAIEGLDSRGMKAWYKNGVLHNENGPAVANANGRKEWWVEGVKLTEEEFDDYVFKKFLRDSLDSELEIRNTKNKQKI